MVQCIRLHTSTARDTVSSLVKELRSHVLCDMAKEKKYIAKRKILSQGHENYLLFQGPSWAMNGMCVYVIFNLVFKSTVHISNFTDEESGIQRV